MEFSQYNVLRFPSSMLTSHARDIFVEQQPWCNKWAVVAELFTHNEDGVSPELAVFDDLDDCNALYNYLYKKHFSWKQ
jgi:hypothetical protein